MIQTAKLEAYANIKAGLPKLQKRVYDALDEPRGINHIARIIEVRYHQDLAYSTITARLSELEGKGLICKTEERIKGQTIFKRTRPGLIEHAKKEVARLRFEAWLKEGEKFEPLMSAMMQKCRKFELGIG